ncbi:unnamed protein product [Blepharisma stoltei]|uniref:Uncharacterized protein n=1 Tax=Blepharisma stoltei TaxID=1481888 RepID=A0AAU9JQT8_9CILI|nr:unnamed protein product [Blepharisma stoltei]
MEPVQEDFMTALQKRKRNLTKKLERIKLKEAEVKASGKEVKGEEKKMLDSKSQTEDFLAEVEKIIELCKNPQPEAPKEKKPVEHKVEEDRSIDAVNLWVLGEFLKNSEIKDKFKQENPSEGDLESFLHFHSGCRGQAGDRFSTILDDLQKSVKSYLNQSDQVAPGTLRTYKGLYEFAARAQKWCETQVRPDEPVKPELSLETTEVHHHVAQQNTLPPPEPVQVQEPAKVEEPAPVEAVVEEIPQKPEEETKVILEHGGVISSNWADIEDEEEEELPKEEVKEDTKKVDPEDEGFVEVGRKKPKRQPPPQEAEKPRGRGKYRGRGEGRGERRPRRPRG